LFGDGELDPSVAVGGGVEGLVIQHGGGLGVEEQAGTGAVDDLKKLMVEQQVSTDRPSAPVAAYTTTVPAGW
jgi:hypothetical protein